MSQLPSGASNGEGLVSTMNMELAAADSARQEDDMSSPEKSPGEKSTFASVVNHDDVGSKTGDIEKNKLQQADIKSKVPSQSSNTIDAPLSTKKEVGEQQPFSNDSKFSGINAQRSDGPQKGDVVDPSVDAIAASFAIRSNNENSSTATADTTQLNTLGQKSDVDTSNNYYVPPVEKQLGDNNIIQTSGSHGIGEKSEIKMSNSNPIIQQMQTKLLCTHNPQATTAHLLGFDKVLHYRKRKIMQLDEEKWEGDQETTREYGDKKRPPPGTREDDDDEGGNQTPYEYTTSCNVKTDDIERIDNGGEEKRSSYVTKNVEGVETSGLPKSVSTKIADVASHISPHDNSALSVAADPTQQEKAQIMAESGTEIKQLNDLYVNNRMVDWKPRLEAKEQYDSLPVKMEVDDTSQNDTSQNDLEQQSDDDLPTQSLDIATDETSTVSGRKSASLPTETQCDSLPVKKEVDDTSQNDLKQKSDDDHPTQSLDIATDKNTTVSGRKSPSLPTETLCDNLPVRKEVDNTSQNDTSQNDLKRQCDEHPQSLVMATDESLVTPFIYFVMQQVKPCVYDRSVSDKRRQKFDNGFRGFECLHCAGQPKPRQFFYRNVKVFQGNYHMIPSHLLTCNGCSTEMKSALKQIKVTHSTLMKALPTGSYVEFFTMVWERLQSIEIPPPTAAAISNSPPVVHSNSPPESVSRQCSKCAKVLSFRSERAAAAGLKMHLSRCLTSNSKTVHNDPVANDNVRPSRKRKPVQTKSTISKVYSMMKNQNMNFMKTVTNRRQLVDAPDVRPCLGCTWCDPKKETSPGDTEKLCPLCKLLEDEGWFRWVDDVAKKIIFNDHDGKRHHSVRAMLSDSTKLVGQKINKLTRKEKAALFSSLYVVDEGGTPSQPQRSRLAKKESKVSTAEGDTKTHAKVPRLKSTEKDVVSGINNVPDFAQAILSKKWDVKYDITESQQSQLEKAREPLHELDPRPVVGCEWCCYKKICILSRIESECCPICASLRELGWGLKVYSTARRFYKPGNLRVSPKLSLEKYLSESTDIVGAALASLSPSDRAELEAKFAKNVDTEESSSASGEESEDGDGSEYDDAFISGLAESIRNNSQVTLKHNFMISSGDHSRIENRKQHVKGKDLRPAFGCSWCGVGKMGEACPICKAFEDNGWSLRLYTANKQYMDPSKQRVVGVKQFLSGTTDMVCKAIETLSRADLSVLKAKYTVEVKKVKEVPVKKSSSNTGRNRKREIIETSEPVRSTIPKTIELPTLAQLLGEKKGLSGVLEADVFQVFNSHFGTNSNIAARILLCLGSGELPPSISDEIPFLRTTEEVKELSTSSGIPPSKMAGVFCVKNTLSDGTEESSFGVALPQFYVNCDWAIHIGRTPKGYILPKVATVNNQPVLLRIGIKNEDDAGRLFAFCYRVLYGSDAVSDILSISYPSAAAAQAM